MIQRVIENLNIDANYHKGIDNHAARTHIAELTEDLIIRRLTEIEVCRLQGLPDDYFYKDGKLIISQTQVYKSVGNSWQSDTVAHILSYLK